MSATFIRRAQTKTVVSYARSFVYADDRGAGFSFPCTAAGKLINNKENPLSDGAKANYAACLTGKINGKAVLDRGIVKREHSYKEPAILHCLCGRNVTLFHDDVQCKCGRHFNIFGQELAPRSQWGEETGEHF